MTNRFVCFLFASTIVSEPGGGMRTWLRPVAHFRQQRQSDVDRFGLSKCAFYDLDGVTPAPSNLFMESFSGTPNSNGSYSVIHGGAQTAGSFPPYTASVNIVSPLYFADGSSIAATPAPGGTYINMSDRYVGQYPGASPGNVLITGQSMFEPGIGISLFDAHELEKDLFIGSGPTYGEYGFVMDITVKFTSGITLTTGPLVDVFAVSDPNFGDFADNALSAQQDAATKAIYRAAMADVNGDGIVNGLDIAQIASHWLKTGTEAGLNAMPVLGDANRDGVVNGLDIAAVASFWEASGGGAGTGARPCLNRWASPWRCAPPVSHASAWPLRETRSAGIVGSSSQGGPPHDTATRTLFSGCPPTTMGRIPAAWTLMDTGGRSFYIAQCGARTSVGDSGAGLRPLSLYTRSFFIRPGWGESGGAVCETGSFCRGSFYWCRWGWRV